MLAGSCCVLKSKMPIMSLLSLVACQMRNPKLYVLQSIPDGYSLKQMDLPMPNKMSSDPFEDINLDWGMAMHYAGSHNQKQAPDETDRFQQV